MNKKQKVVLWIATGVLCLLFLFPPWGYESSSGWYAHLGVHFIFSNRPRDEAPSYSQPLIQSVIVALIAGGAVLALKDKD